ncbi:hypothetical protein SAMN05216388_101763 [Halorientalis persicus]|uniref:Uncharacterized protein n=1 Tax=Halorientalis persicus TaxID=1367881 RepID=A0A1H8RWP4_9EURY|nr:hypothetical protein [Halorientalis persicus]SEO70790.1 hypothetical protein SAMN05216388_101763 [Halorientalis persicus]
MTTLRCPECGTPHTDPPNPAQLPRDTTVYVTCEWCDNRYGATVYTGPDDPSDEIPPGMLAMAQLVGGGTALVCGNLRGNTAITSQRQAQAAGRMTGGGVDVTVTGNAVQPPANAVTINADAQTSSQIRDAVRRQRDQRGQRR